MFTFYHSYPLPRIVLSLSKINVRKSLSLFSQTSCEKLPPYKYERVAVRMFYHLTPQKDDCNVTLFLCMLRDIFLSTNLFNEGFMRLTHIAILKHL